MPYPPLQQHERVNYAQQNRVSLAGVEAHNRREAAMINTGHPPILAAPIVFLIF